MSFQDVVSSVQWSEFELFLEKKNLACSIEKILFSHGRLAQHSGFLLASDKTYMGLR